MTHKKSSLFADDLQRIAELSRVMSHPARLAILRYLAQCKTCISGDISKEIPLSRTTVSQHLQELKKVGLIKGQIEGLKVNYCLCEKCIQELKKMVTSFFQEISVEQNNQC
ncbi:MAG: metalloregulator ArsR/SmtB family transcription factor [Bacteroidales bacterium]|jgi:DNA-binding transcriptional ArsR family regulator|nr:metalloregulator ArsR/SmtB family transcription factor [Bacteroidales bacterium]